MKFPQIAVTPFSGPLTRLTQTLVCCLRRARSASRSKPSPRAVPGRGRSAEAVDESETGSANFFGPARSACPRSGPVEGVWGTREGPPATTAVPRHRVTSGRGAPTASPYRSRRDVLHLGGCARALHLGRSAVRRGEQGHGARAGPAVLRRDLPVRPLARRRRAGLEREAEALAAAAREGRDEQPCELVSERLLEADECRRPRIAGVCQGGAVLEQQLVASLALRKRGVVHGPVGIDRRSASGDP